MAIHEIDGFVFARIVDLLFDVIIEGRAVLDAGKTILSDLVTEKEEDGDENHHRVWEPSVFHTLEGDESNGHEDEWDEGAKAKSHAKDLSASHHFSCREESEDAIADKVEGQYNRGGHARGAIFNRENVESKSLSDQVDDYAHHPQEIATAIDSIRKLYPERTLIGVFQPHLYTR
ncbi:MAG: hypothetical protein IKM80_01780, partial [Bacilli bacterium]|nr:hypothetical protein [Bacilli bacterium]